jgi:hypothetical protein
VLQEQNLEEWLFQLTVDEVAFIGPRAQHYSIHSKRMKDTRVWDSLVYQELMMATTTIPKQMNGLIYVLKNGESVNKKEIGGGSARGAITILHMFPRVAQEILPVDHSTIYLSWTHK